MSHKDGMQYVRNNMIASLKKKGVSSGAVLDVMARVPRHMFVSEALRFRAYDDISLPIGHGQTVSKPSIIGRMVQSLNLRGDERVLEVGTGSGYQSAVISALAGKLVSMERIKELSDRAKNLLFSLGYSNIQFLATDTFTDAEGLFDCIIVCAGADIFPSVLLEKLAVGGTLLVPVTEGDAHLIKKYSKRRDSSIVEETIGQATFVPLIY